MSKYFAASPSEHHHPLSAAIEQRVHQTAGSRRVLGVVSELWPFLVSQVDSQPAVRRFRIKKEKLLSTTDSLRDQIYNKMLLKETDELIQIWQQHDIDQWTETAFEVVREILQNRLGELPSQDELKDEIEVARPGRTLKRHALGQALKVIPDTFAPGKWTIIACLIIK